MAKEISSQDLQNLVIDSDEFALLDIRPHEVFLKGHIWLAISVPLNVIETRISRYVPRLDTRIVLIDQNQDLTATVAKNLQSCGYSNVCILSGGFDHWQKAGLPSITGDYVLAHAFGMYLGHTLKTPSISADELQQKLEARENVLVIDSRDPGDYEDATLPASINIPIAEIVYRIPDLVDDDSTTIVVHCGGVTRGILGAQTLIDAKLPNPVMYLPNGTTGWRLSGRELRRGETKAAKPASKDAITYASKTARNLAEQWNLVYLKPVELEDWIRENKQRTCYLIDVRSREEFLAGHYANAMHVPGGELAGMTQDHIATYNARLCLIGDARTARAEITASWMLKNGWADVVILEDWENESETGDSINRSETANVDDVPAKPTGKPDPVAMDVLQASVDNRQKIFEGFMQHKPRRFDLNESKPAGG